MWTARDGAPQGILELARSRDGILWIGSEGGLFTFDGHAFNAFQSDPGQPDIPSGEVTSILAARDGAVWAGFYEGCIARILHHHVTLYAKAGNVQLWGAQDISQATDGSIWAVAHQSTLARFGRDGKWHVEPSPAGVSGGKIPGLFVDSLNVLWVAQGGRLYERPLAQPAWHPTDAKVDWPFGFAEAPDHTVWINDYMVDVDHGRTQRVNRSGNVLNRLADSVIGQALLYVPDGSLVLATDNYGLRRYATTSPGSAENPETYTHLDGLSSDAPRALLLDDDGNIWVGGQRGLDRFRKARLTPFVTKGPAGEWSICAGGNGSVWLADDTGRLYEVSETGTKAYPKVGSTYSISCGNDGVTRLVDERGVWEASEGGIRALPAIPGVHPHAIAQIAATSGHTLFASIHNGLGEGWLWQFKGDRWTTVQGAPPQTPYFLYVDSHDGLWTGYRNGLIGHRVDDRWRVMASGTPGLGPIHSILETSHGMFAAGLNGLASIRDNRVDLLTFANRTSSLGAAGLAESGDGDLWLNASHGIVRIRARDLVASLKNPRHPIRSTLVTEGDFVGPVRLLAGHPTTARDSGGNLWFATLSGVLHLDPGRLTPESHPPVLSIKSVAADGAPPNSDGTIGPQPQTLDIQYLGVNLTAPEDVTYRYRLDGLDYGWQDAGHRTEAIYTHLRPGTYTFRVMASNDGRTWTAPVSAASLTVLPSFYQTGWFIFACASAGLLLLWFIYTARIRSISHAIRSRANERADERIRIARELHDTLLQGFQGLLLTFHVAAQKVPADDQSKPALERALSAADRMIVEGRNRVSSLRSEHLSDGELVGSLQNVGRDLGLGDKTEYRVRRFGIDARLHPYVAEEVFYIAREALTNAVRHADASHISVELSYTPRTFEMTCKDNGRGFEPAREMKPKHWGLAGMAERAKNLGGKLRCESAPAKGTKIVFTLASRRAYKDHSRMVFFVRRISSLSKPGAGDRGRPRASSGPAFRKLKSR